MGKEHSGNGHVSPLVPEGEHGGFGTGRCKGGHGPVIPSEEVRKQMKKAAEEHKKKRREEEES